MKPVLLTFEHDEDAEGWCSFCRGSSLRGVRIRHADVTGGVPQVHPSFDRDIDKEKLKGRNFYYRIGTCCIGKMVSALETRGDS
jgi:hypothetical protein